MQDRAQWRRLIRIIDPHIYVGKDAEEEKSAMCAQCSPTMSCVYG